MDYSSLQLFDEKFSMVNLSSKTTGVQNVVIWTSVGEVDARVKVVEGTSMTPHGLDNAAVVTISDTPKLLHGKLKKKIEKEVITFIVKKHKK